MQFFYHLSRTDSLIPGQLLDLIDTPTCCLETEALFKTSFPSGITKHGEIYLFSQIQNNQIGSMQFIEAVFELIRRAEFPEKPSRFQSIYGCETIEEAKAFRDKYPQYNGKQSSTIWEVECAKGYKVDMNWLNTGNTFLDSILLAKKYWGGVPSLTPMWEILMCPPVRCLRKV